MARKDITDGSVVDIAVLSEATDLIPVSRGSGPSTPSRVGPDAIAAHANLRATTQVAVTSSATIAYDSTTGKSGIVTLTENTVPVLVVGMSDGEEVLLTIVQDSVGGHHVQFSNFTGDALVSKIADKSTTVKIFQQASGLQRVSLHSSDLAETQRVIIYPGGGDFTDISSGAPQIWDQVEEDFNWTWAEVNEYEFCCFTDLQYSGPNYSQGLKNRINALRGEVPNMKVLAFIRQDLWWFFNEQGIQFSDRAWGTIISGVKPTAAMGKAVITVGGLDWTTAQADIEANGYTIMPGDFATITNNGALLTNPYEIALDSGANWWCRNNQMDVNNDAWLEILTDNLAAQYEFGEVDGFYIQYQKFQDYSPTNPNDPLLTKWMAEWKVPTTFPGSDGNPGWDLTTNTGGSGPWGGGQGEIQEKFDEQWDCTQLDAVEGVEKLVLMLRNKIPQAHLKLDVNHLDVRTWRHQTYRTDYQAAANAEYGDTPTEADERWAASVNRTAGYCDSVHIDVDVDAADFPAPFYENLRKLPHSVRVVPPQDISLQADW